MRKLLVAVLAITLIPALAAAGGGGGDISQCNAYASGTQISMLDSCFQGIAHFAPAGQTITIRNDGGFPHTYTAVDGSFNTGQLGPGEEFDLVIDQPGIVKVFCSLHGTADGWGMSGVLLVGEPEVPAMSAGIDEAAIREAVAQETGAVFAEVSRQNDILTRQSEVLGKQASTMVGLRDAQDDLVRAVGELSPGDAPTVADVPGEAGVQTVLIAVFVGLALGLAVSAVLLWTRSARREERLVVAGSSEPEVAT